MNLLNRFLFIYLFKPIQPPRGSKLFTCHPVLYKNDISCFILLEPTGLFQVSTIAPSSFPFWPREGRIHSHPRWRYSRAQFVAGPPSSSPRGSFPGRPRVTVVPTDPGHASGSRRLSVRGGKNPRQRLLLSRRRRGANCDNFKTSLPARHVPSVLTVYRLTPSNPTPFTLPQAGAAPASTLSVGASGLPNCLPCGSQEETGPSWSPAVER